MSLNVTILLILIFISICNGLKTMKSYQSINKQRHTTLRMNDKEIVDDGKTNGAYGFVGGLGVSGSFCIDYSLYVLKTTGCNIIPNPKYGELTLFGEQGLSAIIVLGVFAWSLLYYKENGKGLPAGPAGLLGAAEGLSYLTVAALLVFLPWQFIEFGGITASSCQIN